MDNLTSLQINYIDAARNVSVSNNTFYNVLLGTEDIFDPGKIPYPGLKKEVTPLEIGLKVSLYAIVIIAALVGNGLVIFIVWKNQRMWNTTNFYLVNLAVADYLVTLMCSWVHCVDSLTEGWVLGAFFCKVNTFGQVLALTSSILTLTLISCDRFFGIVFAMKAHLTERRSATCIAVVWLCALAVASPLLKYRHQDQRRWADHQEIWCDDAWPPEVTRDAAGHVTGVSHQSRALYYTLVTVVLFFIPIVVMTTAYTVIIWKLWVARLPGEQLQSGKIAQDKVKRKVAIMLLVLLALFVTCWLPLQASILYHEYRPKNTQQLPAWYEHFKFVATFVAHSNSALNPAIYAGFNDNFRRGFLNIFSPPQHRMSQYSSIMSIRRDSSAQPTMMTRI